MELKQLLQQREKISAIAVRHGAYNVRIFGSVARGEATSTSDIDFLIDYDLSKTTPWFRRWFDSRFRRFIRSRGRYRY